MVAWMLHGLCFGEEAGGMKPCIFPCKVAAAGDERYLVCAAVAVWIVSRSIGSSSVFCQRVVVPVCVVLCVSWISGCRSHWNGCMIVVAFCRFQTSRCFISRGRRGTSWHSDVFCNLSKMVLCGRRNTLHFSWQAQHFRRVHRHFAWQAQHFRRVEFRVFCESHWQGCVEWRQGVNSVAGVAFCGDVLKIDGSLARNINFEVANLEVPKKTRRKTSILKLKSVKIGGSLARNARFGAATCLVSSLWCSCGFAVSYGRSCKNLSFWMFPSRLSCRFAWQAFHFVTFPLVW